MEPSAQKIGGGKAACCMTTGAGVLRDKPDIKWKKDKGKDTESSPWYPLFHGDRINDHHLTLDEKQRAREAAGMAAS